MVVPLTFEEENNKKHHHRSLLKSFQSTKEFVDIEEAIVYTDKDDDNDDAGNSNSSNTQAIEAADGVTASTSNLESSAEKKSSRMLKGQTNDAIALTPESASSCKCILLPHGDTRTYWDLYICVLLIYVGTFVPYRVSFLGDVDGVMEAVELFVDISFGIDIILNFFTGYETTDGHVEIRCRKIALRYIKSYFILDLIATIPLDKILELLINDAQVNGLNKAGKLTKLPRLIKILRIAKLLKVLRLYRFKKWIRNIQVHYSIHQGFTKLMNIVIIVLFATHLVACLWHAIGVKLDVEDSQECINGVEEGWVCRENLSNKPSRAYIAALYWSFSTLTTVGYGDISARSIEEQIFSMLMMLLGVSWYAYTVGSMSTIMTSFDKQNKQKREKMIQVNAFIRETSLPSLLGSRVRRYFEYSLSRKQNGLFGYDADEILHELSNTLCTEVICFVESDLIKRIPFFDGKSPTFVANTIQLLRPVVVQKGEYIIQEGSASDEMYFLIHGTAAVYYGQQEVKRLSEGAYFGEIGCILGGVRKASIVAFTQCELRCLSRQHLNQLLGQHPSVGEDLKQVARARMKVVSSRESVESSKHLELGDEKYKKKRSMISTQQKNLAKLEEVDFHNLDNGTEEFTKLRKHLEGMNRKLSITSAVLAAEGSHHVRQDKKVFEEINNADDAHYSNNNDQDVVPVTNEGDCSNNHTANIEESTFNDDHIMRLQNILSKLNEEDNHFVQTFLLNSIVHHTKRKMIEYNASMQEQQTQGDHG